VSVSYLNMVDLIENRSIMRHSFQQHLILTPVESGASSSLRQFVHGLFFRGVSQHQYIGKPIEAMPLNLRCKLEAGDCGSDFHLKLWGYMQ